MNGHDAFAELAAGYALGALDAPDAAEFERHLAGCAECDDALRGYRGALVRAADDLRIVPPPGVRRDVLRRLGPSRGRRRLALAAGWAASVALAAAIAAVVSARWASRGYDERLAAMAREVAALRGQIGEEARTLALLGDPATEVVSLAGLAPSPAARARLVWNPRAGGLLVTADLPSAPPGKAYELWAIAGGKPLAAGVFVVDANGHASVRIDPIEGVATVEVFAVTLEPAGGVAAPTGPMVLASKGA